MENNEVSMKEVARLLQGHQPHLVMLQCNGDVAEFAALKLIYRDPDYRADLRRRGL